MREQKRISNMTDRELRAYKRKRRRERELRIRRIQLFASLCVMLMMAFSYHAITSSAKESGESNLYKYYTEVTVPYGTTLYEMADEYVNYDIYRDKDQYISEVCHMNHLSDADQIHAGQKLVFPYFSECYVK